MTQDTIDLAQKLVAAPWWNWGAYKGLRAVWGSPAQTHDGFPPLVASRVTGPVTPNEGGDQPDWARADAQSGTVRAWISAWDIPDLGDAATVSILNRLAGTEGLDGPAVAQHLLREGPIE